MEGGGNTSMLHDAATVFLLQLMSVVIEIAAGSH